MSSFERFGKSHHIASGLRPNTLVQHRHYLRSPLRFTLCRVPFCATSLSSPWCSDSMLFDFHITQIVLEHTRTNLNYIARPVLDQQSSLALHSRHRSLANQRPRWLREWWWCSWFFFICSVYLKISFFCFCFWYLHFVIVSFVLLSFALFWEWKLHQNWSFSFGVGVRLIYTCTFVSVHPKPFLWF